ncbi:dihydrofolate reductase [Anseongella ginsenosidimutans]|uniref:Dihydrofolate reductase n=1 Tax=Anseongella ginsenosidimutans TaxID=496056 RepID=A0A4R3KXJ1_9SPHI|nr:dihydrofolate reductase family protein [Anseongella ginsenosidimutans]QEC51206.1 dihydrofolate reductase [Anseongella ginsenosidimutans]TCS90121.1 dihydrofolate reductase [Anseongella ginsenosidimutans]
MRKLVASINLTLDGFMAGPRCELDWHFRHWTEDMAGITGRELSKADTILLGRITYEGMAAYWSSAFADLSFPRGDLAIAEMMNNHTKVVFSRSLVKTGWRNARLAGKNIRREISMLKRSGAAGNKNIILFGSGTLASTLMQLGLIDEYLLWIHPVILGQGKLLFKDSISQQLRLTASETFSSGVVLLRYEIQHQPELVFDNMPLSG